MKRITLLLFLIISFSFSLRAQNSADELITTYFTVSGGKEAKVYVDGNCIGKTNGGMLTCNLPKGAHTFTFKTPNYKPAKGYFTLPACNQEVTVHNKMIGRYVAYSVLLFVPPVWSIIWMGPKFSHAKKHYKYLQCRVFTDE